MLYKCLIIHYLSMDNSIGSSVSSSTSLLDTVDGEENVLSLVQRAKTGDLSAFDSLMVRYRQAPLRCYL